MTIVPVRRPGPPRPAHRAVAPPRRQDEDALVAERAQPVGRQGGLDILAERDVGHRAEDERSQRSFVGRRAHERRGGDTRRAHGFVHTERSGDPARQHVVEDARDGLDPRVQPPRLEAGFDVREVVVGAGEQARGVAYPGALEVLGQAHVAGEHRRARPGCFGVARIWRAIQSRPGDPAVVEEAPHPIADRAEAGDHGVTRHALRLAPRALFEPCGSRHRREEREHHAQQRPAGGINGEDAEPLQPLVARRIPASSCPAPLKPRCTRRPPGSCEARRRTPRS